MENQRNMILAVILMGIVLIGWDLGLKHFYPHFGEKPVVASTAGASGPAAAGPVATPSGKDANPVKPTREGGLQGPQDLAAEAQALKVALASPNRVAIDAPGLKGSINLTGALVDDLTLNRFRETPEPGSPPVRMFSPYGTPARHYAQLGWQHVGDVATPGADTLWQADGHRLTPASPVTLTWANTTGQTYAIRYAIDDNYMLTVTQSVTNAGATPVTVQPFAQINRTARTASMDSSQSHSGPIGSFDGAVNFSYHYNACTPTWFCIYHWEAVGPEGVSPGQADWIGFTDIYWLSALIPDAASHPAS